MTDALRRLWHAIRHRRFADELAEELAFHRAMKERELEAAGVPPAQARLAAHKAFGSAALAQDQSADVWVPRTLQGLAQDVRVAVRTLWSTRLVTAIAILSLGLGIGANTALFSLVNGLVLRVRISERVAEVEHRSSHSSWRRATLRVREDTSVESCRRAGLPSRGLPQQHSRTPSSVRRALDPRSVPELYFSDSSSSAREIQRSWRRVAANDVHPVADPRGAPPKRRLPNVSVSHVLRQALHDENRGNPHDENAQRKHPDGRSEGAGQTNQRQHVHEKTSRKAGDGDPHEGAQQKLHRTTVLLRSLCAIGRWNCSRREFSRDLAVPAYVPAHCAMLMISRETQ